MLEKSPIFPHQAEVHTTVSITLMEIYFRR